MTQAFDLTNKAIKRVLIIKWSALGDIAMASAIFEDVALAFPNAKIDLNTLPAWSSLFKHDKRFNQIIDINIREKGKKFKNMRQWLKLVRQNKYDLVVDLQSNDRSRLFLTLLGLGRGRIPYRIGNNQQFPYNIRPLHRYRNTFKRCQSALEAAGIPVRTMIPVMTYTAKNRDNVKVLQAKYNLQNGRYAVFFPGSQAEGYLKRWGVENYAALAELLRNHGIDKTVLIGAEDEQDECQGIEHACKGDWIVNLCAQTEILDIIPLCEDAKYIVANDTGTARIAASTNKPLLMIFGPTNPDRDTPGGERVGSIQVSIDKLSCIKCFRKTCDHHSCMKMLTPEVILERLLDIP